MGGPIGGLPFRPSQYMTTVMLGGFQGGPQLGPNDASVILLCKTGTGLDWKVYQFLEV